MFTNYQIDPDGSYDEEGVLKPFENSEKLPYKFLISQIEKCPDTGRLHEQGYVVLKYRLPLDGMKKMMPTTHFEYRKGTHSQAKAYCSKEESRVSPPNEYGSDDGVPERAGDRTDLNKVKKLLDDGKDLMDVASNDFGSFVKYNRAFQLYIDKMGEKKMMIECRESAESYILDGNMPLGGIAWQAEVWRKLQAQDTRKLLWVVDGEGHHGKSDMANWLESKGAFRIGSARKEDTTCLYQREEYVVFDYERADQDKVQYGLLEQFKNGKIVSTKYMPVKKYRMRTKLVVFANWMPKTNQMSEDRWDIHVITPGRDVETDNSFRGRY